MEPVVVYVFTSYWWLAFPIMWFAWGLARQVLDYRHRRNVAEVMKVYAAHGKQPPAEILRAAAGLRA